MPNRIENGEKEKKIKNNKQEQNKENPQKKEKIVEKTPEILAFFRWKKRQRIGKG